jgi:hypothetical protein
MQNNRNEVYLYQITGKVTLQRIGTGPEDRVWDHIDMISINVAGEDVSNAVSKYKQVLPEMYEQLGTDTEIGHYRQYVHKILITNVERLYIIHVQ